MVYKCTVSNVNQKTRTVDVNIIENDVVITGVPVLESCGWLKVNDLVYLLARESGSAIEWGVVIGKELN